MWRFNLSTGDTIYADSRQAARDLARWYRTHTDPRVSTSTVRKVTVSLTPAERFFYDNAGYAYDPANQTEEQGHIETARGLAHAESRFRNGPYYADVVPDDIPYDGDAPYDGPVWVVTLYRYSDGQEPDELLGSLGGVACESDSDPYIRVVTAELAGEYLPAQKD